MEANGQRTRAIAIRGNERTDYDDDDADEVAVNDEDDGEGEEDGKLGRVLGKTMSGSWKGTKKLLGYSTSASREKEMEKVDADQGYSEGAPLKKSVSTGGFIGA